MTRINCIPPQELTREHLVAEYRELPRTFKLAVAWHDRDGRLDTIPPTYRLGTGHVKFFYDKLGYLLDRQLSLIAEMLRRGYTPQHTDPYPMVADAPSCLLNDWTPTDEAMASNRERIAARLRGE